MRPLMPILMGAVLGVVIVFALVILSGCASAPVVAVTPICLPLRAYTAAQEHAMASAVMNLPNDSPLIGAMADFGAMRAADRACLTPSKP